MFKSEVYSMVQALNHIGLSVVDLEESVRFYTEVMEMEIDYRAYHEGRQISEVVDVEDAVLDICVVKKGSCRIELIKYGGMKDTAAYKRQNEPGLIHISFAVSDVDAMYERIHARGYRFYSPPMVTREKGPKICYFQGPDNVIIELYETRV
jgi:catechol 2,3-dioxygenase-like lactoylglutathione lyase family enzyme